MAIGGFLPGKVTTIGGRSGMGKTALLTEVFKAGLRIVSDKKAEYLFLSWEMGEDEVVDRQICNSVGLSYRMLTQGAKLLDDNMIQKIRRAYRKVKDIPVEYHLYSTNIVEVQKMIIEFVKECRKKEKADGIKRQPVIAIDYLGLAQFEGSGLRTYGIGDFMNGIKVVCNDTGAHTLILTQLKRDTDGKEMPGRADFADSAIIEMASDNLLILHRPEYQGVTTIKDPDAAGALISSEDKSLFRVLKCRAFGTGDFIINSVMKYFRFWDRDHTHDFEYWKLYADEEFWRKKYGLPLKGSKSKA